MLGPIIGELKANPLIVMPTILALTQQFDPSEFATILANHILPLFALQEPMQIPTILLENLETFTSKLAEPAIISSRDKSIIMKF